MIALLKRTEMSSAFWFSRDYTFLICTASPILDSVAAVVVLSTPTTAAVLDRKTDQF